MTIVVDSPVSNPNSVGSAEGLPAIEPGERSALPAGGGGVRADRDGNIWANMNHGVYRCPVFTCKRVSSFNKEENLQNRTGASY